MWSTSFAQTPWRLVVICILCVSQVFCREGPCSQELMNEITALLEEKFLNIDQRLSQIERSLGNGQRLQEKTFKKIEDTREVILQENQEMKTELSSALSNVTEILQKDINECIIKSTQCDHVRTNTEGSCVCFCMEGYKLKSDNKTCEDIDECISNSNDCDHVCTNTEGSFDCSCNEGYELKRDNKTCEALRCPASEGYFRSPGEQCFKVYRHESYNWQEGATKCQAEGLQLAKPRDDDAVWIRKYVYDNYGSEMTWVGGRGDGTYMRWIRNQEQLLGSNSLWSSGQPGSLDTDRCLGVAATTYTSNYKPNTPYYSLECASKNRILCELV